MYINYGLAELNVWSPGKKFSSAARGGKKTFSEDPENRRICNFVNPTSTKSLPNHNKISTQTKPKPDPNPSPNPTPNPPVFILPLQPPSPGARCRLVPVRKGAGGWQVYFFQIKLIHNLTLKHDYIENSLKKMSKSFKCNIK